MASFPCRWRGMQVSSVAWICMGFDDAWMGDWICHCWVIRVGWRFIDTDLVGDNKLNTTMSAMEIVWLLKSCPIYRSVMSECQVWINSGMTFWVTKVIVKRLRQNHVSTETAHSFIEVLSSEALKGLASLSVYVQLNSDQILFEMSHY
jgi:hypothetical protein